MTFDEKFSNENVKEMLSKVFQNNKKMLKVLDEIVDTCENQGKFKLFSQL